MNPGLDRVLQLAGTRNLRDLGGYATVDGRRTRWRVLYRSDCLDKIDPEAQQQLIQTGLRTIIDLRDDHEVAERPNVFVSSRQLTYRRIPVWDEPLPAGADEPDPSNGYIRELDLRGARLAEIVETVATPGIIPVLIHCAAGKDRTGLVIGLLLAAVGVPHSTIAEDYALSAKCLGPEYLLLSQRWVESRGLVWERVAHLFETPPERMLKTLAYVDEGFGRVDRYLVQHGLTAGSLEALRESLTETNSDRP